MSLLALYVILAKLHWGTGEAFTPLTDLSSPGKMISVQNTDLSSVSQMVSKYLLKPVKRVLIEAVINFQFHTYITVQHPYITRRLLYSSYVSVFENVYKLTPSLEINTWQCLDKGSSLRSCRILSHVGVQ